VGISDDTKDLPQLYLFNLGRVEDFLIIL